MKNELELKHIAGYLPYGLKIYEQRYSLTYNVVGYLENEIYCKDKNNDVFSFVPELGVDKLILRPLSDLTKEITHNGETFVPIEKYTHDIQVELSTCLRDDTYYELLPYFVIQKLYEWHFDIHNLIEKNLAIDLNTI